MRKTLKIGFTDFWKSFDPTNNLFTDYLKNEYTLDFSLPHDYIISSVYGNEYVKHDCIRILFNGENNVANFNWFDYAIGFDYLNFDDRYLRIPNFVYRNEYKLLDPNKFSFPNDEELLNRDFCSIVVSNTFCADPLREIFFRELSKYKKVDSGGRCFNNIGYNVLDKHSFIKKYKFNIAFENSSYKGYTTEKITDALAAYTVPIYYGNPYISQDINPKCFINLKSKNEIKEIIEKIVELDNNDTAYLKICKSQRFLDDKPYNFYINKLEMFLNNIFNKPLNEAKRICNYGWQYQERSNFINMINKSLIFDTLTLKEIRTKITKKLIGLFAKL